MDRPYVLYLGITIGDALITDKVPGVAQLRVDVVAGNKKDLQSLTVVHCLVTLYVEVVVPINAVEAAFFRIFLQRSKKRLRLSRNWAKFTVVFSCTPMIWQQLLEVLTATPAY